MLACLCIRRVVHVASLLAAFGFLGCLCACRCAELRSYRIPIRIKRPIPFHATNRHSFFCHCISFSYTLGRILVTWQLVHAVFVRVLCGFHDTFLLKESSSFFHCTVFDHSHQLLNHIPRLQRRCTSASLRRAAYQCRQGSNSVYALEFSFSSSRRPPVHTINLITVTMSYSSA